MSTALALVSVKGLRCWIAAPVGPLRTYPVSTNLEGGLGIFAVPNRDLRPSSQSRGNARAVGADVAAARGWPREPSTSSLRLVQPVSLVLPRRDAGPPPFWPAGFAEGVGRAPRRWRPRPRRVVRTGSDRARSPASVAARPNGRPAGSHRHCEVRPDAQARRRLSKPDLSGGGQQRGRPSAGAAAAGRRSDC
jgi:hypothetical protein